MKSDYWKCNYFSFVFMEVDFCSVKLKLVTVYVFFNYNKRQTDHHITRFLSFFLSFFFFCLEHILMEWPSKCYLKRSCIIRGGVV